MGERRAGVVADFDDGAGWGRVRAGDGAELFLHCTAITDGSRTIAPGTPVTFVAAPGANGRWEATDVRIASAG